MAGQCAFHCIVSVLVSHLLFCSGISELDFTIKPHDVVALQEQFHLWECEVRGSPPIHIIWRQDDVEIESSGRRTILENGPLWFQEVVTEDKGHYQCCATNNIGTVCSRTVKLEIATLSIPEVRLTTSATISRNARLVCDIDAYPKPQIVWFKDDESLDLNNIKLTALESGVLQISDVDETDAGEYWCSAINLQGNSTSDSFQLNLTTLAELPTQLPHQSLMIVAAPQNATVIAGTMSTHTFECAVSSGSFNVKWTRKDKRPIPRSRREFFGLGNLQLTNIEASDRGWYICTATNPENSSMLQQARAYLSVIEPPVFTHTPEDIVLRDVSKARLHCGVEGFPTPAVTWVYNGELLDVTQGRKHKVESNNDLVIWHTKESDSGIYQCVAKNPGGEVQAGALVTINAVGDKPAPPYNLSAVALSSQSILIKWTPPDEQLEAYLLKFFKTSGGHVNSVPVSGDATSYILQGMIPYTNYTVFIESLSRITASESSQTVSAMTLEGKPSCAPVFQLTSNSQNTIDINWQPVEEDCRNGVIIRYRYCYRQTGHKTKYKCGEVRNVQRTSVVVRLLQPSTVYSISMAAATMMGFGTDSVWEKISTLDVRNCKVPPAYTLEWSIINSSLVEVYWRNSESILPNITVNGFTLIVTNQEDDMRQTEITLGPELRSHTFTDLEPGANYDVELYAFNDCGNGQEWQEELSVPSTNNGINPNCTKVTVSWPPPYNLQTTGASPSSISLRWTPPDGNITPDFYCITYKKLERGIVEEPKSVYSSTSEVTVSDLHPFTLYNFTVQAVVQAACRNVFSKPSKAGYIRTLEDEPSAPQRVGASALDSHTVAVIWEPPKNPNGIIACYIILYSQDRNQPETVWNVTEKSGDTHTDVIEDLSSDTKYYFRVRASNQAGTGPASQPVVAKTPKKLEVQLPTNQAPNPQIHSPLEKGILASIVMVTFLCIVCMILVICRVSLNKRNRRQDPVGNGAVDTRQDYTTYSAVPRANGQQTHGGMDMEMSPMLPGNRYHCHIQGNGTPDRHTCNSNHSPQSVRDTSQQGSANTHHLHQTSCDGSCRGNLQNQQFNPSASNPNGSSLYNENTSQYLPRYQFNSGQSSPRISGRSSPHHLHMDQEIETKNDKQSVLKSSKMWQKPDPKLCSERDNLRLHLPYTLSTSLAAATSCTGNSPAGSHHPQLPPQTNNREEGATAAPGYPDHWNGDESHHPLSCGESTGGDSGMIEDVDWDTQDTSPDFVDKALMEVSGDASLYVV